MDESNIQEDLYQVKLKLEVEDHKGNKEYLSKTIQLPFPPYIGLQILLEDSTSGNPTDPIKTITWNQYSEVFLCNVVWRFPPDTDGDEGYWALESHLAVAASDGWEKD